MPQSNRQHSFCPCGRLYTSPQNQRALNTADRGSTAVPQHKALHVACLTQAFQGAAFQLAVIEGLRP